MIESNLAIEEILEGAPDEVRKQLYDALTFYATPGRGIQDEISRAGRLRGAYNAILNWLFSQVLPDLNDAQWLFLSTGLLEARAVFPGKDGNETAVDLVSSKTYEYLAEARASRHARPPWAAPILDLEDRIRAIAKGELTPLDPAQGRRRKAAKPIGSQQFREKTVSRIESLAAGLKETIGALENRAGEFEAIRSEQVMKNLKLNLEAARKFVLLAGRSGNLTEQESKFFSSVREKLRGITRPVADLGAQLQTLGRELGERANAMEGKLTDLKSRLDDLARLETGEVSASMAFDPDTINAVRRDQDTLAQFAVHGAEASENKVGYSASRILVKEQWQDDEGGCEDRIASVPAVVAAIEKISKIHVNVFPRDEDGSLLIPPILIEPIRNYVEFFDDRLVMGLVSGESPRKGPKISFSPVEMQVLKACGHYLGKDQLYDYHGELNVGTFIGDYSGKVEKKTMVKWVGDEKKFSMASTSQVVDGASRTEAVNDYMDCIFAFANGLNPPQKLSRRKIGVILGYCRIESVERTVALILLHVAQLEPAAARSAIMRYARSEGDAKDLVRKAFADPQVSKICGEQDFFLAKIFGRSS